MKLKQNFYQLCSKCIMDTSDPDISFNNLGECNYCSTFDIEVNKYCFTQEQEQINLDLIAKQIHKYPGKEGYDSILGMSGGVDSSYVSLLANRIGVRPLCVHFDNGWNSEVAVTNIKTLLDKFGFDLYTYVIDWNEFRDLQRAFIKAGVIDLEMLSDHAIFSSLFKLRQEFKIKYVLSGTNFRTENGLPLAWNWSKMDWKNIKSIHEIYGETKLKTFPRLPTWKWQLIRQFGIGGEFLEPLNKVDYIKSRVMKELEVIGWRYYGGKHYESTITKFYQTYYLPKKFGIDKRRCHISALIRNKELTRNAGLEEISLPPISAEEQARDKEFVLKKLGFTEQEFDGYMESPPVSHDSFRSDRKLMSHLAKIGKFVLHRK